MAPRRERRMSALHFTSGVPVQENGATASEVPIVEWGIFGRKPEGQPVKNGRFELERDGEVAYLQYSLTDEVLELIHTEVPEKLRKHGIGAELAEAAFRWARENHRKVDVVCPSVHEFLRTHPEYQDLVLH